MTWHAEQNVFEVVMVHRVVWLCSVEREEDGKSEGLNEGVNQHKVDGEVCGWDGWIA